MKEVSTSLVRKDEDLSRHSSLGSGGKAEYFSEPGSMYELRLVLSAVKARYMKLSILGQGTHTIIPDEGVRGLVISTCALKGLRCRGAVITSAPGETLDSLINFAIDNKLTGLGGFGGICGSVGGAVVNDMREKGTALRSFLLYADFLSRDGRTVRRPGASFKLLPGEIVTSLAFRLKPTKYTAEARMMKERFVKERFIPPCPRFSGKIFKTPEAPRLLREHGLVGENGSLAEFSAYQPDYIFTYPGCTSREVLDLIEKAERAVPEKLERAVSVLGTERKGD